MINSIEYFNSLYDGCIKILREFREEGRKVRYLLKRDGYLIIEDFYGNGGFTIQGCKDIGLNIFDYFDEGCLENIKDDDGLPLEGVERIIFSKDFLKYNTNQLRRYLGYSSVSILPDISGAELYFGVPNTLKSNSVEYPRIYDLVENSDVVGRKWLDLFIDNESKRLLKEILIECLENTSSNSLNIFKIMTGVTDYILMYDTESGGEFKLYVSKELLEEATEKFKKYDEVFLFRLSKVFMCLERADRDSTVLIVC